MPHLCVRRTDIPKGVLQVLDLWPNTSQRNSVIDPEGQTRYLSSPTHDSVSLTAFATVEAYEGLGAYLVDNVVAAGVGAGTGAFTATQANTAAAALLVIMRAGGALTEALVNTALSVVVATTGIATGGSTGSVAGLLKVLSNGRYVVPAGALVEAGGNKEPAAGDFDETYWKPTVQSGALEISRLRGQLAAMKAATFVYRGTAAAAVVVYGDDGSVL